jgi:hypothetical protein
MAEHRSDVIAQASSVEVDRALPAVTTLVTRCDPRLKMSESLIRDFVERRHERAVRLLAAIAVDPQSVVLSDRVRLRLRVERDPALVTVDSQLRLEDERAVETSALREAGNAAVARVDRGSASSGISTGRPRSTTPPYSTSWRNTACPSALVRRC